MTEFKEGDRVTTEFDDLGTLEQFTSPGWALIRYDDGFSSIEIPVEELRRP